MLILYVRSYFGHFFADVPNYSVMDILLITFVHITYNFSINYKEKFAKLEIYQTNEKHVTCKGGVELVVGRICVLGLS